MGLYREDGKKVDSPRKWPDANPNTFEDRSIVQPLKESPAPVQNEYSTQPASDADLSIEELRKAKRKALWPVENEEEVKASFNKKPFKPFIPANTARKEEVNPAPAFMNGVRRTLAKHEAVKKMEEDRGGERKIEVKANILPISMDSLVVKPGRIEGTQLFFIDKYDKKPIFVSSENEIKMSNQKPTDMEIIAMLDVSTKMYGTFDIFGDDEFKARTAALAGKYGFSLNNPELKDIVERNREEEVEVPAPSM